MKKIIIAIMACALCAVSCTSSKEDSISRVTVEVSPVVTYEGMRYALISSETDTYLKWFNGSFLYGTDYILSEDNTITEDDAKNYFAFGNRREQKLSGNILTVTETVMSWEMAPIGNPYEYYMDMAVATSKYILIDVYEVYEVKNISEFTDAADMWVKKALAMSENGARNVFFVFQTPSEEQQTLAVEFTKKTDGLYYTAQRKYEERTSVVNHPFTILGKGSIECLNLSYSIVYHYVSTIILETKYDASQKDIKNLFSLADEGQIVGKSIQRI